MSQMHSELLSQAILRLSLLPRSEQDRFAIEILAGVCSEEEWILFVASEPYQTWLEAESGQLNGTHGEPLKSKLHMPAQI
jgi:hypothetical protein